MKYEDLFQWDNERFYKEYKDGKESGLLINADCLSVMKTMDDKCINLLLTDPPYGIDFQSQRKKDKSNPLVHTVLPFTSPCSLMPFLSSFR